MSSASPINTKIPKSKGSPKLPWWVELLFVQIGLPDKWLLPLLRKKNKSIQSINENRKKLLYLFILIIGIVYLQPYTNYIRRNNKCFVNTFNQLKSKDLDESFTIERLRAKATNYCNGGQSNLIF